MQILSKYINKGTFEVFNFDFSETLYIYIYRLCK